MSKQILTPAGSKAKDSADSAVVFDELEAKSGNGGNGDGSIAHTNLQGLEVRGGMRVAGNRQLPGGESSANGASALLWRGPPGLAPFVHPIQGRGRVLAHGSFATSVTISKDRRFWMIPLELKGEDLEAGPLKISPSELAAAWNSLGVTHAVLHHPENAAEGELSSLSTAARVALDRQMLAGLVEAWAMTVMYSHVPVITQWYLAYANMRFYVTELVRKLTTLPPSAPPVGVHQVHLADGGGPFIGRSIIRIEVPMVVDMYQTIDGQQKADCWGSWEVLGMPDADGPGVGEAQDGSGSSSEQQRSGQAAGVKVVMFVNPQGANGNHEAYTTTWDSAHGDNEDVQNIPPAKKPKME